jgi:hypothetical protein
VNGTWKWQRTYRRFFAKMAKPVATATEHLSKLQGCWFETKKGGQVAEAQKWSQQRCAFDQRISA